MTNQNRGDAAYAEYQRNMRRNQAAIDAAAGKMKNLEKQEEALRDFKKKFGRYFEEYRHVYAGTNELNQLNTLKDDMHEQEAKVKKALSDERTSIKAEQKRLNAQEEEYRRQYRSHNSRAR